MAAAPFLAARAAWRRRLQSLEGDTFLVADERLVVVLDEARRSLDQQKVDFSGSRDLATSLLSIGALATSFIGGLSIRDGAKVGVWTWVGVVAFAVMAVIAGMILRPRKTEFEVNPATLITWVDLGVDEDRMRRELALFMEQGRERNVGTIRWMNRGRTLLAGLLLVEIVALLIDLRGR